jgi:hypothetical protein
MVTMISCLTRLRESGYIYPPSDVELSISAGDSTIRCGNGTWVCRLCYVQISVGGLGISSIDEEDLSHGRQLL